MKQEIDLRYIELTRMKYSTFEIRTIENAIIELCNIYDFEESYEKGSFIAIYHEVSNVPCYVDALDIINKNSGEIKFSMFINTSCEITFYATDKKDGTIGFSIQHALENYRQKHFDTKTPSYIIRFINYVIDYRIENDLKEITRNQVQQLLKEFLKKDLETIKNHFITLEAKEIKELQERSAARKRILEKIEE